MVGHLSFSDGNERPLYHVKAPYRLSEAYGINVYARGRRYTDSDSYGGNNLPDKYYDYLGSIIGIRKRLPFVRGTIVDNTDWKSQVVDGVESPRADVADSRGVLDGAAVYLFDRHWLQRDGWCRRR